MNKPTHNGPGRGTPRTRAVASARKSDSPRTRTAARQAERAGRSTRRVVRPDENQSPVAAVAAVPRLIRGVGFTRRAIVLLVVCAILLLSYASSLRVYLRQERELAVAQQLIAERTAANAELGDEIKRWQDEDFVKAQARQRLGWVVPGEVGYRVVDANGKPLDSTISIQTTSTIPQGEHGTAWWDRLSGSVSAADEPLVPEETQAPVVKASEDSPSPSTSASSTPTPTTKR
ncbi:FtsB family cell division protein [Luteococcus sp. Sow4_B9]|uniref:FtsB family cell division protein n=1 Tax=Luteococcus sp. Sow4_B9 TaxID=3438792 RepID=UPI003F972255